ncbi:hypothetical protein D3C81_1153350 [compost metagenome]
MSALKFDWREKGFSAPPAFRVAPAAGLIVYRCFDGTHPKKEWGEGYFSSEKPTSVLDAEMRFNIVEWGNLVRFVSQFRIVGGVGYYEGVVWHGECDLHVAATQIYVLPPLATKVYLEVSRELLKQDCFVSHREGNVS